MSETTAEYRVQRDKAEGADTHENIHSAFASWGLEILKLAVLIVLYQEQASGGLQKLTRLQISERCSIKKPGDRAIDNVPLIEGILFHLLEDGVVESNAVSRWWITEKGISLIEGVS
ncbi:MAG: hypothetical protein F4X44_00340 [Gammaproteobacteria bacterium]|nr:hypothetical protein [Gammaproteobacteria bacterium]